MKRLIIAIIILAVSAALCFGRNRSRGQTLKIVQLPEPKLTGPISLEQALQKRRSSRHFNSKPLNFIQLGQLAWAGQGITDEQKGFRTAPSAGAIYPMKLYFATPQGVFVYNADGHSLEQIFGQDIRESLARAALDQSFVAQASCDIIIAGSVKKLAAKYHSKARRYMLMEAGHIAQNILLQTTSLGLAAVPIGAFDVNKVRKICGLPMTLEPLYIIPIGYPATKTDTQEKKVLKKES